MPLHLLGKKSWNVYNTDNIARVRKDEAAAQAQEEEQERRWREDDADRRLQLLRGHDPAPILEDKLPAVSVPPRERDKAKKKRRLVGEDDTDRDIRLAREEMRTSDDESRQDLKRKADSLSRDPVQRPANSKTEDEAGSQGMRFKDAAGYKQGDKDPWYTGTELGTSHQRDTVSHNVWGNEDPRRREREQRRVNASDPLLAMKRGVKKLRENEKERKEWMQQRERDMHEVEELAREKMRRKRHRRGSNESELGGFRLDGEHKSLHSERGAERRSRSKHQSPHHRHKYHSASPHRSEEHHRHRSWGRIKRSV